MAYAEVIDGRILLTTEFVERDLIKQAPGFTWDAQLKTWKGPLSWGSCQVLRGIFNDRLVVGPGLVAWATEEHSRRIEPCLALRELTDGPGDDRLLPFQRPGVSFLAYAQQALLADDMGTGKTVQSIMAVNALEAAGHDVYPVCCVVPNSTKSDWETHWREWATHAVDVFVISSSKNKKKAFKDAELAVVAGRRVVVIINWEAVRLHSKLAPYGTVRLRRCVSHGGTEESETKCEVHDKELNHLPFRTVFADEAHKQKDPKSKQTRAVWAVQHQAVYRFSLTGTPLANHPGDVWAIMHGIAPLEYPAKTKYNDRYCIMAWAPFGGLDIVGVRPDTRDEYFRILDPRMRRMPKDLVLRFLPKKTRMRRTAEMTPKQKKAYQEIEDGMVSRLDDGRLVVTTTNLTKKLRLLQFSSSYATVNDEGHVRLSNPSSKIDVMLEVLEELGDKPVVVAAESRQLIELACQRLDEKKISWRAIIGGMTDDQRTMAKTDFMDGRARVMLFTIKAGGVGLTLTAADTIVFLQRSWSMLENKQAEDRVHRIGSEIHESITVVDLVAPGTVEEDQILRLYEKAERLEEIVRDKELLRNAASQGDRDASYRLAAIEAEEEQILASDLTGQELLPTPVQPQDEGTTIDDHDI